MAHSPLTSRIELSNQCSSRGGRKIDRFIVHHAASTSLNGVIGMMVGETREVSANYVVGDEVVLVVDEDMRAWTSASAEWDGRAITVETINESADGWPVSDVAFWNLAALIADCASRYGFPITDETVITHQELYTRYGAGYATACPGTLQDRKGELIALANRIAAGDTGGKEEKEEEVEDLVIIRNSDTGEIALVNPGTGRKWHMPVPEYAALWEARGWAKRIPDAPQNEFEHYLQMTCALGAIDAGYEGKLDEIAALVSRQ